MKLTTVTDYFNWHAVITVCLFDLQLVLNAWGDDLNGRAEEKKRSIKGKLASATHMQTVSYIKPLFKKLKRRVCDLMYSSNYLWYCNFRCVCSCYCYFIYFTTALEVLRVLFDWVSHSDLLGIVGVILFTVQNPDVFPVTHPSASSDAAEWLKILIVVNRMIKNIYLS